MKLMRMRQGGALSRRAMSLLLLILCTIPATVSSAFAQAQFYGIHGTVTDPSGASVPAAIVQAIGPKGEQRQSTQADGQYKFTGLPAGKYRVRFIAKGFSVGEKQAVDVSSPASL